MRSSIFIPRFSFPEMERCPEMRHSRTPVLFPTKREERLEGEHGVAGEESLLRLDGDSADGLRGGRAGGRRDAAVQNGAFQSAVSRDIATDSGCAAGHG